MTKRWLIEYFGVRPNELRAVLFSFGYFFCLLCGYYVLRPVRDEMGIQGGVENLQWLFTATFFTMLIIVPLFGWVTSKFERARLLPIIYCFFIANLIAFFILWRGQWVSYEILARVFFVWVSVFNLFVVSVFWSFMVDVFDSKQAKRLFGFIAAGGSAGAITGPALTILFLTLVQPMDLLLVSVFIMCLALFCIRQLRQLAESRSDRTAGPIGGSIIDGIKRVWVSPYLRKVCVYVALYTTVATFLYFIQAEIIRDAFTDSGHRTTVFALMDFSTNALTVGLQLLVTGQVVRRWGTTPALVIVPVVAIIGFLVLSLYPSLIVLIIFQVLRRSGNFALARPAREMLFSVLTRDDIYKSKNFVDTVIYRGGDMASGWLYAGLSAVGLMVSGIAAAGAVVAAAWLATGFGLGRARDRLEPETGSREL